MTIKASRICTLRDIAEGITFDELQALVLMAGMFNIREMNRDMISAGEFEADEIPNINTNRSMAEMAAMMMQDNINEEELLEVFINNDLGNFTLDIQEVTETVVTVTKRLIIK